MSKRLFIFAGYDRDGIVDPTLIYYLKSLSELGDIVFTMDNELSAPELKKVTAISNVLHASASRHGEYDFGSYKRGYIWARDNGILKKYDWIYLVNDSVLGPVSDLVGVLTNLETRGVDFTGMVECIDSKLPHHVQSWFVGLSRRVAMDSRFDEFITSITTEVVKSVIVYKYEMRLTQMLLACGYAYSTIYQDCDATLYRHPWRVIDYGVPFIKKLSFGINNKIQFLYPYLSSQMLLDINQWACRTNTTLCTDPEIWHMPYQKLRRLALFGIPLLTVYLQLSMDDTISYKVCAFNNLPILKYSTKNPRGIKA